MITQQIIQKNILNDDRENSKGFCPRPLEGTYFQRFSSQCVPFVLTRRIFVVIGGLRSEREREKDGINGVFPLCFFFECSCKVCVVCFDAIFSITGRALKLEPMGNATRALNDMRVCHRCHRTLKHRKGLAYFIGYVLSVYRFPVRFFLSLSFVCACD